ncbi:MAG: PKD domain-containing protein, partial [Candidatus Thiodiazotropha taylori]
MNRLSFQMLSIVVLVLLSNSVAIGAEFKIEKALWKAEKSLLIVEAKADKGQRLRIENAYDTAQVLKESKLRKETLSVRLRSPEQLPCRIRVVNLTTDRELEQDVKSSDTGQIPQGCSPTGPSEPPVNKAPVADAGIDQLHQLQAGQTSMTVTLDGSGSSDPDGKVADYIWTGSPDPADVVSPSISLNEGTHKFSLIVVDDQRESSASDSVLITVEAAPVEPPPPPANEVPVADAGADQTHQLQVGQSSLTVTLDGSGSMDPDGSVVSYVWDGSPNPADTASPSVTLAEGSYEFTLMVEDNLGEISAPDSVWITVNAPTTEPPATAAEAHASIVIYEGPSTCISCHEDEAVAMHGSVHYQQSGDTINLTNDVTP